MRYGPVDMPDEEGLEDGVDDVEQAGNHDDEPSEDEGAEGGAAANAEDQDEGGSGSGEDLFYDEDDYGVEWEFVRNEGGDDSATSHPLVTH